jgi:chlorobactene glucosyltransferase
MVDLFLAATLLIVEGLLLHRAQRQHARLRPLLPDCGSIVDEADKVCVVVPARNEVRNILNCLEDLLAQTYPTEKLRIVVVDDESDDGTDRIVEAIARRNHNVRLLSSGTLGKGWTGKTQACWTGASACGGSEWLCFIDADMRAEPGLVASAVAEGRRGADMLSLAPRHRLVSFAERLMIPCGLYLLGFQQRLESASSRAQGDVTVAGQFILIRRSLYRRIGGHAAVAGAICEDLELARLANRAGASVALRDGSELLSTRMYDGWGSLWPGFTKNALEMFGGRSKTLATAAVAVLLSWTVVALPVVLALRPVRSIADEAALVVAVAAAAVAVGFHVAGSIHFRIPLWCGVLFPAAYTLGAAIALDGLRLRLAGRVPWKGRVYP